MTWGSHSDTNMQVCKHRIVTKGGFGRFNDHSHFPSTTTDALVPFQDSLFAQVEVFLQGSGQHMRSGSPNQYIASCFQYSQFSNLDCQPEVEDYECPVFKIGARTLQEGHKARHWVLVLHPLLLVPHTHQAVISSCKHPPKVPEMGLNWSTALAQILFL